MGEVVWTILLFGGTLGAIGAVVVVVVLLVEAAQRRQDRTTADVAGGHERIVAELSDAKAREYQAEHMIRDGRQRLKDARHDRERWTRAVKAWAEQQR